MHRTVRCTELFGALPNFELDGRWRCSRDSEGDGEEDGDGEGEGDKDGEEDKGRRGYLKEDGDIEINNVPCITRRRGPNFVCY